MYKRQLVADAKEKGYTETMFGRRRPIPELSSSNFMQRSIGDRVAMNAPIQGTAADIIKITMIKVWKALKEEGLKSVSYTHLDVYKRQVSVLACNRCYLHPGSGRSGHWHVRLQRCV